MSAKILAFPDRSLNALLDPFRRAVRVRVRKLLEDADCIEADTGYVGICVGMEGVVTGVGGEPGFIEVTLDRNGEQIAFHRTELELVR